VELEDIDNDKGRVWYPEADAEDFRQEEWLYWDIPLSGFESDNPDLDLNKLLKLHLGFGTGTQGVGQWTVVYWDDIRLAPPYCNPSERKPQADLSGPYDECDCKVDFYDLDYMADQWLESDCNCIEEYGSMPAPQGEPNLVAWYKFDDGDGNQATDSTSNNYHGTVSVNDVNVFWVTPGANGTGYALEFTGGWVSVPNETKLNLTDAVTVCAWINLVGPVSDSMQIVCQSCRACIR
jgi:hypothetical protein